MIELGVVVALVVVMRIVFNWFDGNSSLPKSFKDPTRHGRRWPFDD